MSKSYEQQVADVRAKEAARAERLGFATIEAYRQHLAVENKKATYRAKIARYQRAIAEMQTYLDTH